MEIATDPDTTRPLRSERFEDLQAVQQTSEAARKEITRRRDAWEAFIAGAERLAACKFGNYRADTRQQQAVLTAAQDFAAHADDHRQACTGALFFGRVGTGKDHLAVCIVREAVRNFGHTAARFVGPEWFGELRDRIDQERSEAQMIGKLAAPDWLLISDPMPPLGRLTDHQASWLYRVLDARTLRGKPTIVTCNCTDATDAISRMGAATWDRIRGSVWVFPCGWDSFRKPIKVVGS